MLNKIPTPAVLLDLDVAEKNIANMIKITKKNGIAHRPHIKAHKSVFLAKKQMDAGAIGITCAKLGEAEVMVENGINDILIAYALIGDDKMERLKKILPKAQITTVVNSEVGAKSLSQLGEELGKPVEVLIEVDGGINRGGLKPGLETLNFAERIRKLRGIEITGLLYYGGNIYKESTKEGIIESTKNEARELNLTKEFLASKGFELKVFSCGSSYSSRFSEHLKGITEVRAGNYIFNDCSQLSIGLAKEEECSLRVLSTIISTPTPGTAIIDAGSKSLTTDTVGYRSGYGYVVGHPEIEIYKLNEEHGFLKFDPEIKFNIGDKISIIPNHACVVPNLVDNILGIRNNEVCEVIKIDARGKNY